jgi:hypothetical protein
MTMDSEISGSCEQDFYAWVMKNARLLLEGKLSEIDVEQIAEELKDRGKSERRALESQLAEGMLHLLKWQFQAGLRGASWRQSIRNGRIAIDKLLRDSPSLKSSLSNMMTSEYPHARAYAIDETGLAETVFPESCPYSRA